MPFVHRELQLNCKLFDALLQIYLHLFVFISTSLLLAMNNLLYSIMAYKAADPSRDYKYVNDIPKFHMAEKVSLASNMTQLIKLLGFGDGDTTRLKVKKLTEIYDIDTSHFVSRGATTPDHIKIARKRKSDQKRQQKEKDWRRNRERPEYFLYQDTRNSDKKRGLENDLTKEFIVTLIAPGCFYCGATDIKIGLDRIDNSLGHLMSNVKAACTRCNLIKGSMPHEAWLFLVPSIKSCFEQGLFGTWLPGNKSKGSSSPIALTGIGELVVLEEQAG